MSYLSSASLTILIAGHARYALAFLLFLQNTKLKLILTSKSLHYDFSSPSAWHVWNFYDSSCGWFLIIQVSLQMSFPFWRPSLTALSKASLQPPPQELSISSPCFISFTLILFVYHFIFSLSHGGKNFEAWYLISTCKYL